MRSMLPHLLLSCDRTDLEMPVLLGSFSPTVRKQLFWGCTECLWGSASPLHSARLALWCLSALCTRQQWCFQHRDCSRPASWGSELWTNSLGFSSGLKGTLWSCTLCVSLLSCICPIDSSCLILHELWFLPAHEDSSRHAVCVPSMSYGLGTLSARHPGQSQGSPHLFPFPWGPEFCTASCSMPENWCFPSCVPFSTYEGWEDKSSPSQPRARPDSLFSGILFLFQSSPFFHLWLLKFSPGSEAESAASTLGNALAQSKPNSRPTYCPMDWPTQLTFSK